jgi:phage anti-repressor protein
MKKFTKQELKEQLGMSEENLKLVMDAQRKFPEILASEENGFCIDGRKLHSNLVENVKTGKDGKKIKSTKFSDWIKGRIEKYTFIENEDYIKHYEIPSNPVVAYVQKFGNVILSQEQILEFNSQQRSYYGITEEYNLTLEMSKQLCMIENNELGLMCRKYFIKIEQAIKDKIEWLQVREPERQGYNNMVEYVNKWCEINGYDNSDDSLSKREANLLNIALTGMSASDIKYYLGYKDINTREHLETKQNQALAELQLVNSSLLMANLDFKTRKQIIEDTCKVKYSDLKITN